VQSSADLARVRRAAARARRARDEYRRALVDARTSGASLEEIARAAGVSRQSVHVLIRRASRA